MIKEKIGVAILSAIAFSGMLALWFIWESRGESSWNFLSLFFIYFIYSSPVFLIGGALYSALVDTYILTERIHNRFLKYITEFFTYVAGGIVVIGIWLIIATRDWDDFWVNLININTLGVGIVAALVFFHISLVWKKIKKTNS